MGYKIYYKNSKNGIKKSLKINRIEKFSIICLMIISIIICLKKNIFRVSKYSKISYLNNYLNDFHDKINYINGKLLWNNETSLGEQKIREEVKKYKNIQLSFENKSDFIKRKNPIITLVITLFNQEDKIKYIYASIQKQELKELEIIFVDDASKDNSQKTVKYLMENDKRIVYLKNKINRRAFYSRYKGILKAKGKYVLVIDPDDLLINNILIKAYETAEKYNLDIVQFYIMRGINNQQRLWSKVKYINGILKGNSEIRKIFYYGISRNLCDKLIRREIYLKSIKFMKKEFYYEDFRVNDDDAAFFGLIHVAESYGFLEQIGYFYFMKLPTPELHQKKIKITNEIFHSIFNIMKYFYIQSDDNILEKRNICFKYFKKSIDGFGNLIKHLTKGFNFIIDTLNLYLNSTYFDEEQKNIIKNFKSKIIERQKVINEI